MKLKAPRTWDFILIITVILLIILSVVIIYSTTYYQKTNFAVDQLFYAGIGLVVLFGLALFDYRALGTATVTLYILGILSLILLLVPGFTQQIAGAHRWYNLGFAQFQPSEIFKLILILTLARYYSANAASLKFRHLIGGFFITLLPAILVALEPDLGTALVYFVIFFFILFSTQIRRVYFLITSIILVFISPLLWFFVLRGYQKARILSFLNPQNNPFGSGYNVLQSTIATGSGGFWGRGLGHGPQSQLNFLPAQQTDFIFASTAEQLGFIGAFVLLGLFFILITRALAVAKNSKDQFGSYIAIGIVGMLLFQIFVNIGMNIGIMPVTGIPLPLVSYGGSSLITCLAAVGLLESIYIRHRPISFL